jgi:hypothetical protein
VLMETQRPWASMSLRWWPFRLVRSSGIVCWFEVRHTCKTESQSLSLLLHRGVKFDVSFVKERRVA